MQNLQRKHSWHYVSQIHIITIGFTLAIAIERQRHGIEKREVLILDFEEYRYKYWSLELAFGE